MRPELRDRITRLIEPVSLKTIAGRAGVHWNTIATYRRGDGDLLYETRQKIENAVTAMEIEQRDWLESVHGVGRGE